MMSSEQLEKQSERSRAEVEQTLQELKARLTPGQLVDEVLCYAKDGGTHFMSNLGKQAAANPLPVTLIGAGLAWLLFGGKSRDEDDSIRRYNQSWDVESHERYSGNGSHLAEKAGETYESAKRGLADMAHSAGSTRESAKRGLSDMAHSAGSTMESAKRGLGDMAHSASSAASRIGHAASDAYETAAEKAARAASSVKESALELERKTMNIAREVGDRVMAEPLALVGIGLALGAILGAAVPNTEAENRLMGDAAEKMRHQATDLAAEQLDKAKDAAQNLLNEGNSSQQTDARV
jgi:hypothetical protein